MSVHRQYRYCAKCGEVNDRRTVAQGARVCWRCLDTPGGYTHCAVGGGRWPGGESTEWVCWVHLASIGRPETALCGNGLRGSRGRIYDQPATLAVAG